MKTYGREFKRLRSNAKVTQVELSKQFGVCEQFISYVENGSRRPFNEERTLKFLTIIGKEELLSSLMTLATAYDGVLTFDLKGLPEWVTVPLLRLHERLLDDCPLPEQWKQIENIIDSCEYAEA